MFVYMVIAERNLQTLIIYTTTETCYFCLYVRRSVPLSFVRKYKVVQIWPGLICVQTVCNQSWSYLKVNRRQHLLFRVLAYLFKVNFVVLWNQDLFFIQTTELHMFIPVDACSLTSKNKLSVWHPYETWSTLALKRQNLCRLIANVGPIHTNHFLFYLIIMVISQDSEPLQTGHPEKISTNSGDSLELALCPNRLHGQPILLWLFIR
jgi:hypothetical protein